MKQVTFRGTGQLNGPVVINKTIEVENQIAIKLGSSDRDEIKKELLSIYYPGVKINPRNISVIIDHIGKTKVNDNNNKHVKKNKPKSSLTLKNIILWTIFLPFKLLWWILKEIFTKDHITGK